MTRTLTNLHPINGPVSGGQVMGGSSKHRLWSQGHHLAPPVLSCVTLGQFLDLSIHQFSHLD